MQQLAGSPQFGRVTAFRWTVRLRCRVRHLEGGTYLTLQKYKNSSSARVEFTNWLIVDR